jgi:hypothetical protein
MQDRLAGILLFLPVPVVLTLLTRFPLGYAWSPLLAIALVLTHRLYARPFALARSRRRCLWCGASVSGAGLVQRVVEPGGETTWGVCGTVHAARLAGFLSWLQRYSLPIRIGILGSLILYLVLLLPRSLGYATPWSPSQIAAGFQIGIAITVLPVGWLAGRSRGEAEASAPRVPFPVHIQALIGTIGVVWLFRLVGLTWLAMGLWRLTGAALLRTIR